MASRHALACAQDLLRHRDAERTLSMMRTRYRTPNSLKRHLSSLRSAYKQLAPKDGRTLHGLRLDRAENRQARQLSTRSREARLSKVLRVDCREVLRHCKSVLSRDPETVCTSDLALALMAVTGRRTTEIMNGRSHLRPVGKHACLFIGQIKKRPGDASRPYSIPVLVEAAAVSRAHRALKARQGEAVLKLSHDKVSVRYQSTLRKRMQQTPVLATLGRVHNLRSFYACAAYRLFDVGDASLTHFAKIVLGHVHRQTADVYAVVDVQNCKARSLGVFSLSSADNPTPPPPRAQAGTTRRSTPR